MKVQIFSACVSVLLMFYSCAPQQKDEYISLEGRALGTFYHITYKCSDNNDYHGDIKELFDKIEKSMSIYDPNSFVYKINESEKGGETDKYLREVFKKSVEISEKTQNAFDITVAPLVNAWGFGEGDRKDLSPGEVDSILEFVGIDKVRLEGDNIIKDDPRVKLDMNAIAKGYMTDVVARFLDEQGVDDYMVEVGGELRLKGRNPSGDFWRIGIDKPEYDAGPVERELQTIVHLTDRAIATSGTYRRFFVEDGRKYSHTIDPHTGFPVDHNLLSVTVVASTAMETDAWATAFMVMGTDKSLEFTTEIEDLEGYFIYEGDSGELEVTYSEGFERWLRE